MNDGNSRALDWFGARQFTTVIEIHFLEFRCGYFFKEERNGKPDAEVNCDIEGKNKARDERAEESGGIRF